MRGSVPFVFLALAVTVLLVLERDAFSIEDILYGENGQPLFPSAGLLRAPRVTR